MTYTLWLAAHVWPAVALSVALLAVSAGMERRANDQASLVPWRNAGVVLLGLVLLPGWASLAAHIERAPRVFGWAGIVALSIGLAEIVAAIVVLRQGRKYWWGFLPMVVTVFAVVVLGVFGVSGAAA